MGRNNLFKFLQKEDILDKDNVPYQEYMDNGFFKIHFAEYRTPLISQNGIDFIRKLIKNQ